MIDGGGGSVDYNDERASCHVKGTGTQGVDT